MDDGGVPQLIRACGDVLALPARVIATALVFFHRFKSSAEVERVAAIADGARLASACIFLASKVEEASLRTNDLVNVVHSLRTTFIPQPQLPADDAASSAAASATAAAAGPEAAARAAGPEAAAASAEAPAGSTDTGGIYSPSAQLPAMLVGDEYYSAKRQLIFDEQTVVRLIHFNIRVEQPYKFLFCYCKSLEVPRSVARLATCLANDSLLCTRLCVSQPAPVVASAALLVAAELADPPLQLADVRDGGADWVAALGLQRAQVLEAAAVLRDVLR